MARIDGRYGRWGIVVGAEGVVAVTGISEENWPCDHVPLLNAAGELTVTHAEGTTELLKDAVRTLTTSPTAIHIYNGFCYRLDTLKREEAEVNEGVNGQIGRTSQVAQIARMVDMATMALREVIEAPGVWEYEVAEGIGAWLADLAVDCADGALTVREVQERAYRDTSAWAARHDARLTSEATASGMTVQVKPCCSSCGCSDLTALYAVSAP